jgi:hypothetical protein
MRIASKFQKGKKCVMRHQDLSPPQGPQLIKGEVDGEEVGDVALVVPVGVGVVVILEPVSGKKRIYLLIQALIPQGLKYIGTQFSLPAAW